MFGPGRLSFTGEDPGGAGPPAAQGSEGSGGAPVSAPAKASSPRLASRQRRQGPPVAPVGTPSGASRGRPRRRLQRAAGREGRAREANDPGGSALSVLGARRRRSWLVRARLKSAPANQHSPLRRSNVGRRPRVASNLTDEIRYFPASRQLRIADCQRDNMLPLPSKCACNFRTDSPCHDP